MAEEEGIGREEIDAVRSIVMAVSAGRVGAQFAEARRSALKKKRAARKKARED